MATADGYRARAQECQALANRTRDPTISQQLLDLANQWRALADQAETLRSRGSRAQPDRV
jgi:hypothetical protein